MVALFDMATYYPDDDTQGLLDRIKVLEDRSRELNIKLMETQSKLSDAEDMIKRWKAELEIVASKTNHNLCHIWIPALLKNTLGCTGGFPDPEGMTEEEFRQGCDAFRNCIFAAIKARQV